MEVITLGVEVPLMEDKLMTATMVREHIKISWLEIGMTVTMEVIMLGVEVPLLEV